MLQRLCLLGIIGLISLAGGYHSLEAATYRKATEGRDVVKNKIYPKDGKFEINGPGLGLIMNQSFINTYLASVGATYYISEVWGIGLDIVQGFNGDKLERTCIENFYFDPEDDVGSSCSSTDGDASQLDGLDTNGDNFPRFGPAYVPVREINTMIMANAVWSPVYGKQLIFMNHTSYFDLFFEFGGGMAMSTYYRKQDILRNGNVSRAPYDPDNNNNSNDSIGATISETGAYGIAGRPDAENQANLMLNLGVGQKFHFGRFHAKIYLRDHILLGTDQGFDNLLSLMVSAGLRI